MRICLSRTGQQFSAREIRPWPENPWKTDDTRAALRFTLRYFDGQLRC